MGLNDMIGKTLDAVKSISEKASENEKGIVDFVASLKKSATDLMEAKDKLEAKVAKFETEFGEMKAKMAYYESKLKKTSRLAAIVIGTLLVLQVITLTAVILLR